MRLNPCGSRETNRETGSVSPAVSPTPDAPIRRPALRCQGILNPPPAAAGSPKSCERINPSRLDSARKWCRGSIDCVQVLSAFDAIGSVRGPWRTYNP